MLIPFLNEENLKSFKTLTENFFRLLLGLADMDLNIMFFANEKLMTHILFCLKLALEETFGKEILKCAMDTLHNICVQCGASENPPAYTRLMKPFMHV